MPEVERTCPAGVLRVRWALCAAAVAAAAVLTGCPPPPQGGPATQPMLPTARGGVQVPVFGTAPTEGGVYESLPVSGPLSGEMLARARMERGEILRLVTLKVLPLGDTATTAPGATPQAGGGESSGLGAGAAATQGAKGDPPPMAVKYYLRGREEFLQGANSEAVDFLEKALALDPEAFTVLRLMGRVCFASSQLARGSMYLERAQKLRPRDVEVNYLLGRYWLERKEGERAVYYLMLAAESPEQQSTSTQMPLSAFYLARALETAGFYQAAAREFERFMEIVAVPVPGYRYDRELSYLIDEPWATHLSVGENYAAVGEYAAALPHYRQAAESQPRDVFIASRLVNALVQTGKLDAARGAAMGVLAALRATPEAGSGDADRNDAIKLVAWTYQAAGVERTLIADLARRLRMGSGDDPATVLTLAAVQDYLGKPADAFSTMRGYLADHPTNLKVLTELLKRVDSADTFREALAAVANALTGDPTLHDSLMKLFEPVAGLPAGGYLKTGTAETSATYALAYFEAIALQAQGAPAGVVEADFHRALSLAPDFLPARDAYVHWLLTREQYSQATQVVRQALAESQGKPGMAEAWELLIESETAQERYLGALKLAQDGHARFPADPKIRMLLAAVYRLRGEDTQADVELRLITDDLPHYEPAYVALVNGITAEARRTGEGEASINALATTLAKLTREVPDSRFGQISAAMLIARSGRLDEAENMLRRVLAEEPDSAEVLVPLAQVRQALGRNAEAIATLADALKSHPEPELVRALAVLYTDQDRTAGAIRVTQSAMEGNPDSDVYLELHAENLESQEKQQEAIVLLQAGLKKFPHSGTIADHLAEYQGRAQDAAGAAATLAAYMKKNGENVERLYALAHYYTEANDDADSTAALQRVLAIMPDHTGANNDLGYVWADTGIHVEQARQMIQKAVDNQPNESAYQDSLGWVLYKEGRLAEAVAALEKAVGMPLGTDPEGVQHLADALYRGGRAAEAIERWSQAQQMLSVVRSPTKREQQIRDYLDKALANAKAGKPVEVTPLAPPGEDRTPRDVQRSAGPATLPAFPLAR